MQRLPSPEASPNYDYRNTLNHGLANAISLEDIEATHSLAAHRKKNAKIIKENMELLMKTQECEYQIRELKKTISFCKEKISIYAEKEKIDVSATIDCSN